MLTMKVTEITDDRVELREVDGSTGCAPRVPPDHGLAVGDTVDVEFTHAVFGEVVRVTHHGHTVLHRDDVTRAMEHARTSLTGDLRKLDDFAERREEIRSTYDGLPQPFRDRIDKFVDTKGPSWWWEFGSYELSACTDAVLIARAAAKDLGLEPGVGIDSDDIREAVAQWVKHAEPETIPGAFDGHSGNSWAFAQRLASLWLTDPAMVVLEHGALTPLVGCKEYGCPHEPAQD